MALSGQGLGYAETVTALREPGITSVGKDIGKPRTLCRFLSSSYFTQKQHGSPPSSTFPVGLKSSSLHRYPLGHFRWL